LQKSEEAVLVIDGQKGDLLMELSARLTEIDSLKQQLSRMEKVVEVKIERVIDGKPEIEQLRNVIAELEMQLKRFSTDRDTLAEEVRKRQNAVDEQKGIIGKLEAEVAELKAYIQKREGSFKWAVEREIERDIAVS
jgi:chromosome segregation ATPase